MNYIVHLYATIPQRNHMNLIIHEYSESWARQGDFLGTDFEFKKLLLD